MDDKVRILGLCGSPTRGGNTEFLVTEALKAAQELEPGRVEIEFITLSGKEIKPCRACWTCCTNKSPGKCIIEDDAPQIASRFLEAHGLIIGSPVYVLNITGLLKNLFDRLTPFFCPPGGIKSFKASEVLEVEMSYPLRNKVGGAIVVAAFPSGGQEHALLAIHAFFLAHDMLVVSDGGSHTMGLHPHLGGVATGRQKGEVKKDLYGVQTARSVGRRVAEATLLLQPGLKGGRKPF